MKYGVILLGCIISLCACRHKKTEVMQAVQAGGMLQDREEKGFHYRLQYMPPHQQADMAQLRFRFTINSSNSAPLSSTEAPVFSYGLDSLFSFVNVTDTTTALDVVRIANGNMDGLEYMLVFQRPPAYSEVSCRLILKDWLFTHQEMSFPVKGAAIKHIDSLSLNL